MGLTILSTGMALPARRISAEEIEERIGLPAGWVVRHSGVKTRYFAESESTSQLGATAAMRALDQCGQPIDCLVAACGTYEQALPCRASLIHRALGLPSSVPAFDIDATCLSFLVALDLLAPALVTGRYQRVLVVSSDLASPGLNWKDPESCALFGDGAAAAVIGLGAGEVLASALETHSEASHLCEIRGGGSRVHPRHYSSDREADFLFCMDGPGLFRLVAQQLPPFFQRLLAQAKVNSEEVTVVPHQASLPSMEKLRRRLGLPPERFLTYIQDYGNLIAASIPSVLHLGLQSGQLQRGQIVTLLGTSAGVSLGGLVLKL